MQRTSLRFQLFSWIILLMLVVCSSLFYLVHSMIEQDMIQNIDSNLELIRRDLNNTFSNAFQYPIDGYSTDLSIPPQALIDASQLAVAQFKATRWKTLEINGTLVYEFKGFAGLDIYEVEVDVTGKVIEIEKQLSQDKLSLVENEFDRLFSDRSQYWLLILGHGSTILTQHGKPPNTLPAFFKNEGDPYTFTIGDNEGRILDTHLTDAYSLRIGSNLSEEENFMASYRKAFWLMLLPSIALTLGVAWFVTRNIQLELVQIEQGIEKMSQGDLSFQIQGRSRIKEFFYVTEKFNQMATRLQLMLQEMRAITDQVSHDLRTPITRIRTQIEVAMSHGGELKDMTGILESCQALEHLITTMLELSEVEANLSTIAMEPIQLNSLVAKAADIFSTCAEDKGLELKHSIPPQVLTIYGQQKMLERVLANLLDNAIKYTHQGSIQIELFQKNHQIILAIQDTGIGIPSEEIEHVCKRFYRSPQSVAISGHGLGLSYVESLLKAHGATLHIISNKNGSRFEMRFPEGLG
jgi:signal transduction histidine kinase